MCNSPFLVKHEASEPVLVPCGYCIACRLEKSRQWAVRMSHEISQNDENCFITLTYNDENLPIDGSLSKRDLQLFFKRLRSKTGRRFRYYASGEYGALRQRPHYHALLFGFDFGDKEKIRQGNVIEGKTAFGSGKTHDLYRSETLEVVWKKGFCSVGEASFESAGYVARYITKKITGEMAPGVYQGKTPEFALMSRRPGLGKKWIMEFKHDVYPKDFFHVNGHVNRAPRFYDEYLKHEDRDMYEVIKERRKEKQVLEHPVRRRDKEKYRRLVTKRLERRLENG